MFELASERATSDTGSAKRGPTAEELSWLRQVVCDLICKWMLSDAAKVSLAQVLLRLRQKETDLSDQ